MRYTKILMLLLAIWMPIGALAAGPVFESFEIIKADSREIVQGLNLWEYALVKSSGEGKENQRLHVLEVSPVYAPTLRAVVTGKNGQLRGTEPTLESMKRLSTGPEFRPLAGINGDFFDTASGGGLGLTISEGRLLMSGEFASGYSFGLSSGLEAKIGQPRLTLLLSAEREGKQLLKDMPIDALNHLRQDVEKHRSAPGNALEARQDNALVLFTPDYYRATMQRDGGYEVTLRVTGELKAGAVLEGVVTSIHTTKKKTVAGTAKVAQGSPMKKGDMVLSAAGNAIETLRALKKGDIVTLSAALDAGWEDITACLGGGRPDGGPLLVKEGTVMTEFPQVADYSYFYPSPHPRTAAGIRQDGSWFLLVAEGYLPGRALGLSIPELAQVMADLGAWTALNLDGSTSSTMVIRAGSGFELVYGSSRRGDSGLPVGNSLIIGLAE